MKRNAISRPLPPPCCLRRALRGSQVRELVLPEVIRETQNSALQEKSGKYPARLCHSGGRHPSPVERGWGRGRAICLIFLLFALSGCIEPYEGKTDSIDSILVVEGIITSGTTQINISKSVGLDENVYGATLNVDHAIVYVECEDGSSSAKAISSGLGTYTIATGELNVDAKYRLVIHLDGEEYHSSYLAPAVSPPVDVTFTKDASNIHVCVTTYGNDRQPGYYLWSYKEDWEVVAATYNDSVLIDGRLTYNDLNSINRYYCWRKDSSRVLILGTTEKLIENTIREKKINTFARTDSRTSVLYRVNVKQNTIHKEGYDFYYNLQKNIEQTGSIFGPIPSEIMGNIRCASNPDIPIIGYIDVSTTSLDEQYLNSQYYNPAQRRTCENDTLMNPYPAPEIGSGYIIYYPYTYIGQTVYIPEGCVDCTKAGGSKRKPKDWPNNHL